MKKTYLIEFDYLEDNCHFSEHAELDEKQAAAVKELLLKGEGNYDFTNAYCEELSVNPTNGEAFIESLREIIGEE